MSAPAPVSAVSHPRLAIAAWALWDWATSAFSAVILSFVFSVYVTSAVAPDEDTGGAVLGYGVAAAGIVVALTAPAAGSTADRRGHRRRHLAVNTAIIALATAAMFAIRPEEGYLVPAVALIAIGSVFSELSSVNYNAMLAQLSTPRTIGRISGLGWGAGYVGGLVALLIVLFGFIDPNLFGVSEDDGLNLRWVALFSAAWIAVFSLPIMLLGPEASRADDDLAVGASDPRRGPLAAYRHLGRRLAGLHRREPAVLAFLISSAIYRDGLAAVFTFAGTLASAAFGFSSTEVIYFAIVANVVAGLGCLALGPLDDLFGPRRVITFSLVCLVAGAAALLLLDGKATFWVVGSFLAFFVGPVQSASRTLLARMTPPSLQGETFGLYATTGRAISFLAPTAFSLCITLFGSQRWGILGIGLVMAVGLVGFVLAMRWADDAEARHRDELVSASPH